MQVSLVPVPNIDAIWPHLREGFQRFIEKRDSGLSTGDLWVKCRSGEAFLIVAHDNGIRGASIWQMEARRSGHKLRCVALFGYGMADWIEDMRAMARNIARDCGANALVSEARLGMQRVFPKAKVLAALYEEPIDG
jgi:hypothetical protein